MTTAAPTAAPVYRKTFEYSRETVRRLAAEAFSRHVIEEAGPNEWRCHRPRTGNYSFRVIVRPSMVLVYGDIGHAVFRGGEAGDTLAWLREAVYSESYLLSKLKHRESLQCFYADDVLDRLREYARDGSAFARRTIREAKELRDEDALDRFSWVRLAQYHGADCDWFGAGMSWDGEALWIVEGLRWFVGHLPASHVENGGAE